MRDLSVLLTQVLKGMAGARTHGHAGLPAPFDEIVRNGLSGEWGLGEVLRALPHAANGKPQGRKTAKEAARSAVVPEPGAGAKAARPEEALPAMMPGVDSRIGEPAEPPARLSAKPDADLPLPGRRRAAMEIPVIFGISQEDMRRWMTAAGLLLVVILFGLIAIRYWSGGRAQANIQPATARQETAATQRPATLPASRPVSTPEPAAAPADASGARWRVVAFTFNHKDQAEKKVMALAHKFPSLWPAVFSPSGRAPWLVTVGGALDRDGAYTLAHKARNLGLPRDTYAQNYNGR